MNRILTGLALAGGILALAVAPALAQTAPPATQPPSSTAPGVSGAPSMPREKRIEAKVKKVDPAAKTVELERFLGLTHTTLEVTGDTQIQSQGRKASLEDIRQGDTVKVSYEVENGKNIAKSIEVMPSKAKATSGSAAPAGGARY